ncbi:hypothetical protein [Amycolatopsis lurida]|uniref:hypothetical protein n=1 Tax=Amycolatopsis lurida TaxID=31959 RepID=UPI0005AD4B2A|nr:hypothetical protein [Amycolatopsis lurida]
MTSISAPSSFGGTCQVECQVWQRVQKVDVRCVEPVWLGLVGFVESFPFVLAILSCAVIASSCGRIDVRASIRQVFVL